MGSPFYLLMPAQESHHGLVAALDDLLLGRLKEAWRDVEQPDTDSPMTKPPRRSIDLLIRNAPTPATVQIGYNPQA